MSADLAILALLLWLRLLDLFVESVVVTAAPFPLPPPSLFASVIPAPSVQCRCRPVFSAQSRRKRFRLGGGVLPLVGSRNAQ